MKNKTLFIYKYSALSKEKKKPFTCYTFLNFNEFGDSRAIVKYTTTDEYDLKFGDVVKLVHAYDGAFDRNILVDVEVHGNIVDPDYLKNE